MIGNNNERKNKKTERVESFYYVAEIPVKKKRMKEEKEGRKEKQKFNR